MERRRQDTRQDTSEDTGDETYNPWSVVNLVFRHLADEGLHPVLGESGDPGKPAAELLRCLGITPAAEGNRRVAEGVSDQLARLRAAFEADNPRLYLGLTQRRYLKPALSQAENTGQAKAR